MNPNTSLGMRASDHYRREKESEAAQWELARLEQPQKSSHERESSHLYRWVLVLLVTASIGLAALASLAPYEAAAQEQTTPAQVETPQYKYQHKGSSGSDGFPLLNMIQ